MNGAGLYIVQMVGDPLATAAATKPVPGHKLDARSSTARAYKSQLKSKQDKALSRAKVTSSKVVYHYDTALNGVAVNLTAQQATTLAKDPSVLNMWKNQIVSVATPPTPKFLGLTGNGGVWKQQFGSDTNAGNGIIIGDLDTGYWPESPSFAALHEPRSDDATIAAKWQGICDPQVTCNNKVIGARWYDSGGLASVNPGEHHSPRDYDGHGSHTASTAAGNHIQNATINGANVGDLAGMAPGARLAVYKVLYENAINTSAQGSGADIVAAIGDAITDGVDVINYSIGDDDDNFSAVELAFLNAAAAGVFVSAAAGNAGPGPGTVDNAMPWEATVAAGTFDQSYSKSVTLGDGSTYTGVGVGPAVPSAPLIDSVDAGLSGANAGLVELCFSGTLDPAKVAGKEVLCRRGSNARTDKSKAVQLAGGVGMILYNATPLELDADYHFVPTVHVDTAAGLAIKTYIHGTASPTASQSAGTVGTAEAPVVAAFSSRGPSTSSGGSLLKPDVMAPGVGVVAAVSPENHSGNLYDAESGTSMATPHIAGIAALIMSKHPTWSPMWVKSAIMTGAKVKDNAGNRISTGSADATALDMGSGQVVPKHSFDTQLVFDSGVTDWLRYSCTIGVHLQDSSGDVCDTVGFLGSPSDLNYPSIAFGSLTGSQQVTRTVTNVTAQRLVYDARAAAPAGYKVAVSPNRLVIPAHGTASFKLTLTRKDAAFGSYGFGLLLLVGPDGRTLRSPIAAQAVPLAAPAAVTGTGTSGSQVVQVKAGYTGTLTTSVGGLMAPVVDSNSLVQDVSGFVQAAPAVGPGTAKTTITVPSGTAVGRVSTFASDYAAGTDVDLFAYFAGTSSEVGLSAGGTADESIDLPPGTYDVYTDVFATPTAPVTVNTYSWAVPGTASGNLTATPTSQSVTNTGAASVTLTWTGLSAGTHYLGVVGYGDGTNSVGRTVVSVNS